ncbi:TPA: hypothetical protein DGD59_03270 [Candidatus Collierbacteria bacterium]|nr:hypothetical protein [Candidatus Collierbacteria bacterium]HCW31707.1 hypothetical protein [Candidatus Collierbacteria bacterium]
MGPKKYLKYLVEVFQVTRLEKLTPGGEVIFKLLPNQDFTLYYVGERPEKVLVDERGLRVLMPLRWSILIFKYENNPTNVEVAYSINN